MPLLARHRPRAEIRASAQGPRRGVPSRELASAASLDNYGWFELLLRTEKLSDLIGNTLRARRASLADEFLKNDKVINECYEPGRPPYAAPTKGTTATTTPNSKGFYPHPVYYDWGANWERVSELVPSKVVQDVLRHCVNNAYDDYYFYEWDEKKVWPFLFVGHRRLGNCEQGALMCKHLLPSQVRALNGIAVDWIMAHAEARCNRKETAVMWAARELEEPEVHYSEEDAIEMIDDMVDSHYDLYDDEEATDQISQATEAILYAKDGPGSVRDVLLCTMGGCFSFLPLNYILAKMLSPKDAQLKIHESGIYCVVVDERRNIVFDNNWYFINVSASKALNNSGRALEPDEFDYSFGGLVEPKH